MGQLPKELLAFASVVLLIMSIIGTIGNVLVATALATSRSRHSATTLLVINLSVSILPICALTMPFLATLSFEKFHSDDLAISEESMKAFYVLTSICNQVELHTIAALAFNRSCAVCSPNFFKRYLTKKSVIWSILAIIWIYSVILWLPVSLGVWGYLKVDKNEYFVEVKDTSKLKGLLLVLLWFILPFMFTIGCHILLYVKFRKTRSQRIMDAGSQPWENHITRTMTGIFLLLIFCSVPHIAIHILKRFGSWPVSWVLIHILYFFRFCLNPVVYIYMSNKYRKDCIQLIKRMKTGYEPATAENSRELRANVRCNISREDTSDRL